MTLVTVHLEPGQTLKELIQEVRTLSGGQKISTVTGRTGVLVPAEVAYAYLDRRFGSWGATGESVGSDAVVTLDSRLLPEGVLAIPDATPPPAGVTDPEPPAPLPGGAAAPAASKTETKSRARKTAKSKPEEV